MPEPEGAGLAIAWHSRCADLPAPLWSRAFPPPFEGRAWFEAVQAGTLPGQFHFQYGLLTRNGVAAGIVPAFVYDLPLALVLPEPLARVLLPLARGPLRALAVQRTFFIGNVAGDEGHVGLVPGVALAEVAPAIHRAARARANVLGAPVVVWKDFPEADREAMDMLVRGGRAFRMASFPGAEVPIHPGGFAALLGAMRSQHRNKLRVKLRKGCAAFEVRASVESQPSDDLLREVFALFEQTRARATTRFETLTPEFFRAIAASAETSFVLLRHAVDGRLVAFMLVFDLDTRIVNKYIGLDYSVAEEGRLYFRLFAAAYDWAATTAARVLSSGQTGYTGKMGLGHALVPLWNCVEHRNGLVNAAYRMGAKGISWSTLDPQLAEWVRAHPGAEPR
jgi:hypothetical protein